MSRRAALCGLSLALSTSVLVGCAGDDGTGPTAVATMGPLGSITQQITDCAGGTTETLMGPGDDPHDFVMSSRQLVSMVKADLVVANGLGLESAMQDGIDNARDEGAQVYEVAPALDPAPFEEPTTDEHGDHEHGHEGHDHGSLDPHVWLDASRMATAATNIGRQLAEATGQADYRRCGRQVAAELRQTDRQVRTILARVPEDRRVLVTDHEAFGYFARAYGFRIVGAVVPGGSTDAGPSSQRIAELAHTIAEQDVGAIFSNVNVGSKVVDNVAEASGRPVRVIPLYVESLGPDGSSADTYQGMMLTDARRIAGALAP